jgi:hypothetical protein
MSNQHANAIESGWMRGWTYRALEKNRRMDEGLDVQSTWEEEEEWMRGWTYWEEVEEGWVRGWTYRALEKKRYRIALPSILGSSTIDAVHRTTETTSVIARIAFQLSAYLINTSRTHVEQC